MTSVRTRLLTTTASVALVAPLTLLAGAGPAHAASWSNLFRVDGGISQACKTPTGGGQGWTVRFRLDNTRAGHAHVTAYQVNRGDRQLQSARVQVGAGKVSAVKSVVVARPTSDQLVGGIGELDGRGLGADVGLGQVTRC